MAEETPKSNHPPASTAELMSSAKAVAEAAQEAVSNQGDKVDKAKVAGAAEDLLDAAKSYGKLDEKSGMGQYVDKAETYLHKYHSEDSSAPAPAPAPAPAAPEGGDKEHSSGEKEPSSGGGGVGDVVNKAKGLFG